MAQIQTTVGVPLGANSSGGNPNLRSGNLGELVVQELHGRYYETTFRKMQFSAATQTAVALTAAFATTYTGLCLSNNPGNTVNLVVNKVGVAEVAAQTALTVIGLMAGYNGSTAVVHSSTVTPACNFLNAPVGQGTVDVGCTLPTAPILRMVLTDLGAAGATAFAAGPGFLWDLEGSFIIPPGGYLAFYSTVATAATSLFLSFNWEELPIQT